MTMEPILIMQPNYTAKRPETPGGGGWISRKLAAAQ